ncbi:MAG: substrate-binding domain-containing protein, partial [Synergistaceae bacterium]
MGKTSYLIAVIAILIGIILVFNGKAKKQDIFDSSREITVISREDGSGTRGAFTELFDVKEEINGKKVDATLQTGDITQSTGVMIENVSSNKYAIGYISL